VSLQNAKRDLAALQRHQQHEPRIQSIVTSFLQHVGKPGSIDAMIKTLHLLQLSIISIIRAAYGPKGFTWAWWLMLIEINVMLFAVRMDQYRVHRCRIR
jgi:hypothetical protein